jgi:hypothetical protein
MKANSLEELVTNSNIAGELRNYTDWHTRLMKFAKLVAEWQYQKDREEFAKIKAKTWCEGFDAHKEKMLKDAVEGEVHPDDCEIWVNLVGYGYKFNEGDKVRIVVLKEEEE